MLNGNPYLAWIETYAGDEYQRVVADARARLERLAAVRASDGRLAALVSVFRRATELETSFWQMGIDAAARLGSWARRVTALKPGHQDSAGAVACYLEAGSRSRDPWSRVSPVSSLISTSPVTNFAVTLPDNPAEGSAAVWADSTPTGGVTTTAIPTTMSSQCTLPSIRLRRDLVELASRHRDD
jgi:hypothetical protein